MFYRLFSPAPLVRRFSSSVQVATKYNVMTIPSYKDNFLSTTTSKNCVVIDPVIPKLIEGAIKGSELNLKGILSTHHHMWHVMGMGEVISSHPGIPVYGGVFPDSNPAVETILHNGESVTIDDISFKVLEAPSHSDDSLIFEFTEESGYPFIFTGDSINMGGCGYIREDKIESLYSLIYDTLSSYPDETCIFHGHENGEDMLKFAMILEPSNQYTRDLHYGLRRSLLKARSKPGTPTCLHDERLVNPFFRINESEIRQSLGVDDPHEAFTALVKRRNSYFKRKWMKLCYC